MQDFVHLHNHTHYSLLDAACTSEELIKSAVEDNHKALAITDHGVMYGCFEFHKLCTKAGIKPILGFESYIALNSRFDKKIDRSAQNKKSNYYHLILLAKDAQGYKNLMKLSTYGHTDGFYYRPRIDKELLEKYHEGIIATSACLAGVVSRPLMQGDYELAKSQAQYYKDLFGDDFYIEIQNHHLDGDKIILEQAPKIANELGIKLIATNDIHYTKKEHAIAHNILLLINKENISNDNIDINKLRYGTAEYYFRTREEMNDLFKDFPDALSNSLEIADKCNVKFENKIFMPVFPIPETSKAKDLNEYLREVVYKGFKEKYVNPTQEQIDRIEYELKVIIEMGFPGYFLIVYDFVDAAKNKLGIRVGPGRGSAVGSMVAYCLGITNLDPLPYFLLFERFLNPERISMPDIDIDFADNRREDIINYVKEKYGNEAVSQIITFGTLSSKAVLKDVGRVLGIPHTAINEINKKIPTNLGKVTPLAKAIELPDLKDFKENNDPDIVKLKEYSLLLEGLYRHSSVHAAGVVIAPDDCTEFIPLVKKDNELVSQYTMKVLEEAGLLKMDFLGLRTLSIIDDSIELIEKNYNLKIDPDNIDFEDKSVYDVFCKGKTVGIFQFESKGMQEYLSQLKPRNLEELTAMNALYRPGPMDNIPDYIARKNGKKEITYLHPIMEKSLKYTYGIIVYQEQVMMLVQDIADFSLGQADILRKAMGKKNMVIMDQQRPLFIEGALNKGIDEKTAIAIFDLIFKFANYGFNKSHSLAYSYLAYQTAYLKKYYPAEFLAANMTAEKSNLTRIVQLVDEAKALGIDILPPDVNSSNEKFVVKDGKIYFAMSAIKNIGTAVVQSIVKTRQDKQFSSFFDFASRIDPHHLNKRMLEALICSGAFDSIEPRRASLYESMDLAINYSKAMNIAPNDTKNLFGDLADIAVPVPKLIETRDWDSTIRLEKEMEFLNFYISGHPLDKYAPFMKKLSQINLSETESPYIGKKVRICGLISGIRRQLDKKGKTIAFVEIEDFYNKGEVICWSNTYEKYNDCILEKKTICVTGKIESENEKIKIYADSITPLDTAIQTNLRGYNISIYQNTNEFKSIDNLYNNCNDIYGKCELMFNLIDENNEVTKYMADDVKYQISIDNYNNLCNIFGKNNVSIY